MQEFLASFHAEEGALAVEEALVNDVHCVVISTCQDVQAIRIFTRKACLLGRHLDIEAVENAISIVSSLKLCVCIEIMLYSQVLHEVQRPP